MSKLYTFTVHTYGADTPHRGKRNLPIRVKAKHADEACRLALHQRPLSWVYMCQRT